MNDVFTELKIQAHVEDIIKFYLKTDSSKEMIHKEAKHLISELDRKGLKIVFQGTK